MTRDVFRGGVTAVAAEQIAGVAESGVEPTHPIQLLRRAYGI
jgi:hypothetical protein